MSRVTMFFYLDQGASSKDLFFLTITWGLKMVNPGLMGLDGKHYMLVRE